MPSEAGFASGLSDTAGQQIQQQGSQLQQALALAESIRQQRAQDHAMQMDQWRMDPSNPLNVHAQAQADFWKGQNEWRQRQEEDNAIRYAEAEGDKAYNVQGSPFATAYATLRERAPAIYNAKLQSAFYGHKLYNPAPTDGQKQPTENALNVSLTGPLSSALPPSIQAPSMSLGGPPQGMQGMQGAMGAPQAAPVPSPSPSMGASGMIGGIAGAMPPGGSGNPASALIGGPAGAMGQAMPQQMQQQMPHPMQQMQQAQPPPQAQGMPQQGPPPQMLPRLSQGGQLPIGQPSSPTAPMPSDMTIDQFGAMPYSSPFAQQQREAQSAKNQWYALRGQAAMVAAQVHKDMEEPQKAVDEMRAKMYQSRAGQYDATTGAIKSGMGPWYDRMKAIELQIGAQKPLRDSLTALHNIEAQMAPLKVANEQKRTGIYAQSVANTQKSLVSRYQMQAAGVLKYLNDQGDGLDDTAKKLSDQAGTLQDTIQEKMSDYQVAMAGADAPGIAGQQAQAKAMASLAQAHSFTRRYVQMQAQAKNAQDAAQNYRSTAQAAQAKLHTLGFQSYGDGKGTGNSVPQAGAPKTPAPQGKMSPADVINAFQGK